MNINTTPDCVTFTDIQDASARLDGVAHKTPVYTSRTCNLLAGCEVYFKCENFQRMGAFKIRGAYNAISQLSETVPGIVAGSSGSHAQAAALAASLLGKKSVIVMPSDALPIKVNATRGYGGEIVFFDRETEDRETVVNRICKERNYAPIPAHNHPHIIAGQGTVALELHKEVKGLDALVIPVSGGGLMAGSAVTTKALAPACRVFGVEPEAGNDFSLSLASGERVRIKPPKTIADGLKCCIPGPYAFSLAQKYVTGMALVTDDEILDAVNFLMTRMKLVVEPSGAAPLAALLHGKIPDVKGKKVGVIISGGNADIPALAAKLASCGTVAV